MNDLPPVPETAPALPAIAFADQPVRVVERDGVRYTLLGTAHVSQASVAAVKQAIDSGRFDAVAVELDAQRLQAMTDPDALAKLDLVQVIRSKRLALFAVNVLGVLPFCAIGLYVGSLVGGNAAPALLNMLYLPMAFLSGLWLPLTILPDILSTIAPLWPAYHLGQLALKVVGFDMGQPVWVHVLVLAGITVLFFVLAQRRLSAAE